MRPHPKKLAFSLIELSLVILIIGILIAGVTSASSSIDKARLQNARSLTQSSPIASIKNLVAWWESTSTASFNSAESEDNTSVGTWYDINPQSIAKFNLTQSSGSNKPSYQSNAINDLPALYFDGSSSYLSLAYQRELNPKEMSVFAVVKVMDVASHGTIISSRNDPPFRGYILYTIPTTQLYQVWSGDGAVDWQEAGSSTITLKTAELISFSKSSTTVNIYKNGENVDSQAQTTVVETSNELRVGAGRNETTADYFLNGFIGELVVFDRVLKKSERQAIEQYLSQKWKINITQS